MRLFNFGDFKPIIGFRFTLLSESKKGRKCIRNIVDNGSILPENLFGIRPFENLTRLRELKDQGFLSKSDYNVMKAKILN